MEVDKKEIVRLLNEVADEYNVKILFCVESGSRAWGMESNDSDYDVRFVFYRNPEEYTLINPKSDVINAAFNEKLQRSCPEGCTVDMQGFDLTKFSKMLSSSNPTVIEWLNSNIVYCGEKPKDYVEFSQKHFNFISLYYHYKSMGRQNYLKYIKPQNNLRTPKKYLYTCRGIINSIWVKEKLKLPPILFPLTLEVLEHEGKIPRDIFEVLAKIIENKRLQREQYKIDNVEILDRFIEEQLKIDEAPVKRHYTMPDYFNDVITPIIHTSNLNNASEDTNEN